MTEEEGRVAFEELVSAYNVEEERIIAKAKREGKWRPGLDSNRDLFVDLKKIYRRLHMELVKKMDD